MLIMTCSFSHLLSSLDHQRPTDLLHEGVEEGPCGDDLMHVEEGLNLFHNGLHLSPRQLYPLLHTACVRPAQYTTTVIAIQGNYYSNT